MPLLDDVMPAYDRSEVHRRRIDAPAAAVWESVRAISGADLPAMRLLMGLRTLGQPSRGDDGEPVIASFRKMGFREVAEDAGSELVIAGIGRFWQLSGELRRVEGSEHFAAFAEPGYAKVAFNFHLLDGELSTETRIAGTDAHARRRFGLYWLLVRPGSGLIRREWLRGIARRAESRR